MREIGADSRIGRGAVDRMTAHTTRLLEKREAFNGRGAGGLGRRPELRFLPGRILRRQLRDHEKMHPGMFGPAKFRTDAGIGSGLVGLNPDVICLLYTSPS